ncbi:MAG: helix-turn-helix domain-containing protein [Candidatus Paceibacterota bacterium]|jgi:predicted transcriptional regulator
MDIKQFFNSIGLTKDETSIYLTLLERGPKTVAEIANLAMLDRSTVYRLVPVLLEKSLVSVVPKGKRTSYAAEPPEKLQFLLGRLDKEFETILPRLKEKYPDKTVRPLVKFLEGRRGIIAVYDDIVTSLKRGDTFYRYSSAKTSKKRGWYVSPSYESVRDSKRLERYVITNTKTKGRKVPRLERYIKNVPEKFDLFEFDITLLIYGPKIAFVDYNSETAVIIENPVIASFQKKLFQLLFSFL